MAGITKLQETITDISEIIVTSMVIAKNPKSLAAVLSGIRLATQALDLVSDLKAAVAEAKDLDDAEKAALGVSLLEALNKIMKDTATIPGGV